MIVLITGVHGFIGSNLAPAFKYKNIIYGLDVVCPDNDGVIRTYEWNEIGQIPSVDVVIHLAGKAHDTKDTSDEKEYFDINVGLTKKIFDYFLKSNASKFIFFSSVKVVADSVKGELLETETPNPLTSYGKSKLEAEKYIIKQQIPEEKKVYILRPSMIHGHGNKGNLNLLYSLVSKGIPWPLGAFDNKRSFTSIDNLIFILEQILENNIDAGIYNISDDEPISTNRLIELIAESQKRKAKIWKINSKLISVVAHIGDILRLPLNTERLKKLTESYIVSNLKIKKALGINKLPVSAEEGMINTLKSFINNKT